MKKNTLFIIKFLLPFLCLGQLEPQWNTTPTIEDHFTGSTINSTTWHTCFQWGNACGGADTRKFGDLLLLEENLVLLPGGGLKVLTKNQQASWQPCTSTTYTANYSSGLVMSKQVFKYGRFEIRAQLPKGRGINSAFWLFVGPHTDNPTGQQREIDIFETLNMDLNANSPVTLNSILTSVHHDTSDDGVYNGAVGNRYYTNTNIDFTTGFHTFVMEWVPEYMKFYVDGKLYWLMPNQSDHFPDDTHMNLIIGSGVHTTTNPGAGNPFINIDANSFSSTYADFLIDYVKVNEYNASSSCPSHVITDNDPFFDTQTAVSGYNLDVATPSDVDYSGQDDGPSQGWCYWQNNYTKIVDPNEVLHLTAENLITMYPGFQANAANSGVNYIATIGVCFPEGQRVSQGITEEEGINKDSNRTSEIILVPNPTNGLFYAKTGNTEKYTISIFTSFGSKIMEISNYSDGDIINMNNESSGLYIVKINNISNNLNKTFKLIKQ